MSASFQAASARAEGLNGVGSGDNRAGAVARYNRILRLENSFPPQDMKL